MPAQKGHACVALFLSILLSMNFSYATQTDPGLLRENNEDAVALDAAQGLVVLADGMGGYNAGEVASEMATRRVLTELGRWLDEAGADVGMREIRHTLENTIGNANRAIYHAAHASAACEGMGTTLVMAVFRHNRVLVAHVGDSRCYRLRGSTLVRLTHDHSVVQQQIDAGLVSPGQAAQASNRNLVTRALGVEAVVMPDINEYRVEEGDLFLLCSDGLSDMLSDERIAALLQGKGTVEQKARHLVVAANGQGGRDNISVALAFARPAPVARSWWARLLGA
jgi:PPM family protein phosphatase